MNYHINSCKRRPVISIILAFAIFFIMSGEFLVKIRAAETNIMSLTQQRGGGSTFASITNEEFLNNLDAVKYLTVNASNSEVHYYCDDCGVVDRKYSTTTVKIYGCKKNDGSETLLNTYTVTGLDGTDNKSITNRYMLTDIIKSSYEYLKITANLSSCTAPRCSHSSGGGYFSNGAGRLTITATTYDEPVFQTGGNLSDKSLTEGVADYIGVVNGYFPSGTEKYIWQYSEGGSWVNLVNGTTSYNTGSHGTLELCDKNGKTDFSSSNMLKLNNPAIEMSGIKIRVILVSGNSSSNTTSNEAVITVNSRSVTGFYSARFASRYGQVGEKLTLDDIISYVKFDNGQIIETQKLMGSDAKRVSYYGFVNPNNNGIGAENTIEGLKNGSISYTELGADTGYEYIKDGENVFYLKFSYMGKSNKDIFAFVTFSGKDEYPPVFEENVELYEKDGMTLYTRGDYAISNQNTEDVLRIHGYISDSVSDVSKIRWAYTLLGTGTGKNEISIPVYRTGNEIDITVARNGRYTLYAEDDSGNTAQKTIVVKSFDENDPVIKCDVTGISDGDPSVCSSFRIDVQAGDTEGLSSKPYLYKYFTSLAEANSYKPLAASLSDYTQINSYMASRSGYYVVAVRDGVGKTAKEVLTIPPSDEYIIDSTDPEIVISPVSVKDANASLSEYEMVFMDNHLIKNFRIMDNNGNVIVENSHNHSMCSDESCSEQYHFVPLKSGEYKAIVWDCAGNKSEIKFTVTERKVEGVEITDVPESMSVNSEISLNHLRKGSRILLKMSDGTRDIYSNQSNINARLLDKNNNPVEKVAIDYGENLLKLEVILNENEENERKLYFEKIIIGEDNVAPLPGIITSEMTEGWDGSLTNDASKQMTLRVSGYDDDGSDKNKLIITWYRDDNELQKKSVEEGGDVYGPFSGEDSNGVYRYTITDENSNVSFSTHEKKVDCWDMTPPTGDLKMLPDGVSCDSKARYKQLQIVNASDDRGLAEKPYSFTGNKDENYMILSSVVAGENADFAVYLKDSAGNVTHLGDVSLTGIDSIAPTINGYEILDGDEEKKIMHIDATDIDSEGKDNSSNLSYSIDGENYQSSPDFEIDESGTYTIYVKDDTGNITKTCTDYTDTDKPNISAIQDESGGGVLIVNVSDNAGLSRVIMDGPDGIREILQVYDGSTEDTIRKEIGKTGEYKIKVTDMAGNSNETTVEVNSIASICSSSILTGLKLSPAEWTNGDVTIIAQLTDSRGLSSSPFKWNNSIPTAQPYMIMTENGEATVEVSDMYGNVIASQTVDITNIDRISPQFAELKQSDDKNHLIIKVSDKASGLSQITISGGPYSVETGAVTLSGETEPDEIVMTLPTNGTYTIRAYDRAGNSSQRQIRAEGVTTDIVEKEYIEIEKIVEKPVEKVVEKVVTEEKVINQIQTVEKPVPILVPVPKTETVIKYKTLKEKGEDTSTLIKGEDNYIEGENSETIISNDTEGKDRVEKENVEIENNLNKNNESVKTGEYTKEGTYIAPDGYEYFGRVDPNYKNEHPFKYWFKKNAEKIAIAACILALIFLLLCIVMGIIMTRDYFREQKNNAEMKRMANKVKKSH